MLHPERFNDLPPHLRRLAATVYIGLALASLSPWLKLGTILSRPYPAWAGIVIGIGLSSVLAAIFARQAWHLLTAPDEPVGAPQGDRSRWHSPTTYNLGAALFATLGMAAPMMGLRWYEGLVFFLLSVACLGEGHRVRRALAAPPSPAPPELHG